MKHDILGTLSLLRDYLVEAHQDDLDAAHHGDGESCSYCLAIEKADAILSSSSDPDGDDDPVICRASARATLAMSAALVKLDDCRRKCPGIGGDVDAMNLRHLLERGEVQHMVMTQAASRLESLSQSLEIDASAEVAELRAVLI